MSDKIYLHQYRPKPEPTFPAVLITEINAPYFAEKLHKDAIPELIGNYVEFGEGVDEGDPWWCVNVWSQEKFEQKFVRQIQGISGSECKYCGKPYHACYSCDYHLDEWLWFAIEGGFCSLDCAMKTPVYTELREGYEKELELARKEYESEYGENWIE